jgi:hypothetical protein
MWSEGATGPPPCITARGCGGGGAHFSSSSHSADSWASVNGGPAAAAALKRGAPFKWCAAAACAFDRYGL